MYTAARYANLLYRATDPEVHELLSQGLAGKHVITHLTDWTEVSAHVFREGADLVHFCEGAASGYAKSQVSHWSEVDVPALQAELETTAGQKIQGGLQFWIRNPGWSTFLDKKSRVVCIFG